MSSITISINSAPKYNNTIDMTPSPFSPTPVRGPLSIGTNSPGRCLCHALCNPVSTQQPDTFYSKPCPLSTEKFPEAQAFFTTLQIKSK